MRHRFEVRPFTSDLTDDWDAFVRRSTYGALQNRRAYLSYHGNRFCDESVLITRGDEIRALFPAARLWSENTIVSHPGAAYGDLVLDSDVRSSEVPAMVDCLLEFYRSKGSDRLVLRPAWPWLQRRHDDTFVYELLQRGARVMPWQLVSVVDLRTKLSLSSRRRRAVHQAERTLHVRSGVESLPAFWDVLESRLWDSHSTTPTHTLAEITDLSERLGPNFELWTAWEGSDLVSGVVCLQEPWYVHFQYIAASDRGRECGATDLLMERMMLDAQERGVQAASLGSSVNPSDKSVNEGLLRFKAEFGASAMNVPAVDFDLFVSP